MKSPLVISMSTLVVGFVIGIGVNKYFDNPESDEASTTQNNLILAGDKIASVQAVPDNITTDLKILQEMLNVEITARKSLQKQLDKLSNQVAALGNNLHPLNEAETGDEITNDEQTSAGNTAKDWFNEKALLDSGMSNSQAAELKAFFEQQELDRMYLRDQSIRENWDRQKYLDEIQNITAQGEARLNQLDEADYDAYLFASGQPNRVKVTSVLESSQAGTAGIQPGDHIVRYDNERIYSGFELRTATSAGDINESVAVEVERDGEILELYLVRGPLGIRMNSVSVAPTP